MVIAMNSSTAVLLSLFSRESTMYVYIMTKSKVNGAKYSNTDFLKLKKHVYK